MYQLLAPLQHVPCSPQIQASPDYVHLSQGLTLHVILAAIHSANYLTDGGESWFIRLGWAACSLSLLW